MDPTTIRQGVVEALYDVAPDLMSKELLDTVNLREAYDIDSADFLSFLVRIHERLGVDIPVSAYEQCSSLAGTLAYVSNKITPKG